MKRIKISKRLIGVMGSALLAVSVSSVTAQLGDSTTLALTLEEAIRHAKSANKLIGVLKTEEEATKSDLAEARTGAWPRIHSQASYQRYTRVTLFEGVLGESHSITKPPNPNGGSVGVESAFNLYAGGRQKATVTDFTRKTELASLNTKEQEANIGLQVALHYLEMVRFYYQGELIKDQVTRARNRLKDINAFYLNGKVTKSDQLRAEVLLSNVLLAQIANSNDYLISNQRLNTILNLDESAKIIPVDTAALYLADRVQLDKLMGDFAGAFSILKAQKNIELQQNRIKLIKTFNLPTATLYGGYGFNYPNTLVFPPQPQTFAVGLVGVKLSFDISAGYHNKHRIRSAKIRETELKQQKDWVEDNIQQESKALTIKYHEAVNRLDVIKKSIEQAKTNYDIQNMKYANQLSLLTDLLEADNLYQESQFNYVQANVAALSIYYRLLFVLGKL